MTDEAEHPTLRLTIDLITGNIVACEKSDKPIIQPSTVQFQCPFCSYVWMRRPTSKTAPGCPKCGKRFPSKMADPRIQAVRAMSDEEYEERLKKGMEKFRGIAGL